MFLSCFCAKSCSKTAPGAAAAADLFVFANVTLLSLSHFKTPFFSGFKKQKKKKKGKK